MVVFSNFDINDLYILNNVNLDPTTENFGMGFYLHYLINWPDLFRVAKTLDGRMVGYVMAKDEGIGCQYHGHISALSVAPEFRRCGISVKLMNQVEQIFEEKKCYYVDLFVRTTNEPAFELYKRLGYSIYRRIRNYYTPDPMFEEEHDAFDMRKPLSKDVDRKSLYTEQTVVNEFDLKLSD
ncbi:hypothetical protein GJ496_004173 [Pomphorhynchus laevis]|nr:hypothetical protein GJ496_004173 [Pomphorhynchus laevis]